MGLTGETRHRRPRMCVRCGKEPRHGEMFICVTCFGNPELRGELVATTNLDPMQTRVLLVREYRWHGGWGRSA